MTKAQARRSRSCSGSRNRPPYPKSTWASAPGSTSRRRVARGVGGATRRRNRLIAERLDEGLLVGRALLVGRGQQGGQRRRLGQGSRQDPVLGGPPLVVRHG